MKFQAPVLSGLKEVMNEFRDGLHTGCWQYAFVKTVDFAAKASRWGVIALGLLYSPSSGLRSSATRCSTFSVTSDADEYLVMKTTADTIFARKSKYLQQTLLHDILLMFVASALSTWSEVLVSMHSKRALLFVQWESLPVVSYYLHNYLGRYIPTLPYPSPKPQIEFDDRLGTRRDHSWDMHWVP